MKRLLFVFLFLLPVVFSLDIGLSIQKSYTVDILYFSFNDTANTKSFSTELLNSGSLPFVAQAKVDIFNGNGTIFTAWAEKNTMMPGSHGFFRLFWLAREDGQYLARLRVYYGGEVEERWMNISVIKSSIADDFKITDMVPLKKYMMLTVAGPETGIVLIPTDYPDGWSVPQRLVTDFDGHEKSLLSYEAPGMDGQQITVEVASIDGKYSGQTTAVLRNAHGFYDRFLDMMYGLLSS